MSLSVTTFLTQTLPSFHETLSLSATGTLDPMDEQIQAGLILILGLPFSL